MKTQVSNHHEYIPRRTIRSVRRDLTHMPAVVLLGPRQVGKTTLARQIASETPDALYLDLEDPADMARLENAADYLKLYGDRLVIIDEVQRAPGLFQVLRGQIDLRRRAGRRAGHFLLLGSASQRLLQQSGESLAGRAAYRELCGLDATEVSVPLRVLWTRGGFPDSLTAPDDDVSIRWRTNFIRSYLERDLPQVGLRAPAETLRRLWTMLAHRQGAPLRVNELAGSLGISTPTVLRYIDVLVDLMIVRRLPPYHVNVGKRLIKTPRLFLRDSGIVHALLGIRSLHDLLGHPVAGLSWQGFVVENVIASLPAGADAFFYRTRAGAEIDLLLLLPGGEPIAVDVKHSSTPRPRRGFHVAADDVGADDRFVVYPGEESYPLGSGVTAVPLQTLMRHVAADPP